MLACIGLWFANGYPGRFLDWSLSPQSGSPSSSSCQKYGYLVYYVLFAVACYCPRLRPHLLQLAGPKYTALAKLAKLSNGDCFSCLTIVNGCA